MTELYGPSQFRLNQGTAKKWRVLLRNTTDTFDSGQLSFTGPDGNVYSSPEGLMASIAEPNPAVAWDGVSLLYDGEQFFISQQLAKRLKLRGTLPDFKSFAHALFLLDHMAAHHDLDIKEENENDIEETDLMSSPGDKDYEC